MEYFNQVTSEYLSVLKSKCRYKIKIELLSQSESVIGEVTRDLSMTNQGQISCNYGNLTRRSCTISVINIDGKYNPSRDSFFWMDRKFKLWVGVAFKENIFWFAQGVFYATDVNGDSNLVTINGVDKGGALDGTLKLNMLDTQYIVQRGVSIYKCIKETLLLNDGMGEIDPTEPLIDEYFRTQIIEADITINENDYIGTLFTQLAEQYGADVYYDENGRLNFRRLADGELIDGYSRMSCLYHFTDKTAHYSQASLSYSYDYVNAVTVFTNINATDENGESIPNVSYTVYNTNPQSPVNVHSIRIRRMENTEIGYINGLTQEKMTERCKQYGEYLLLKSSIKKMAVQFSCTIIPHLDVNRVIMITDSRKGISGEKFVIQELTLPLYSGEMSVSATNVNILPEYNREVS